MDASRYFFQQLSGRFFRIALFAFLLFTLISALLLLRENQITLLAEQELPSLTKQNQHQQQILTTYLSLENLTKRSNADNLYEDYQQAQQQINDISSLAGKNKSKLSLMFVGHKEFAGIIDKLSKKHDRNNQLKQSTIIQLQLINDQLTTDIKDKRQRKQLLFQQIRSDRFSDKVTATRAKAYATQITELTHLEKLQQSIIRTLLAFQQLNLQYSIVEFDDVSEEIKLVLQESLPEEAVKENGGSLLTAQLITLEQLLFSQQNSVAKWRSHLRLTRLYVEFIKQQQQTLQQLVLEPSFPTPTLLDQKLLLIDFLPIEIKRIFTEQKISLNNQHLQLATLSIIALLFLLLLKMIFTIKNVIKNYGLKSIELFNLFIENSAKQGDDKLTPEQLNSAENKLIAQQIQNTFDTFIKPEHSEKEYQHQLEEQQSATNVICQKSQEIEQLKISLEKMELASKEQSLQRKSQEGQENDTLINMVVRTMLQSQSVSIGSGVTSLQVYRQLVRIFDRCLQNKTRNEFLSATQPMTLSDVALHKEMDTALLNIIADTHFQRNKVYYQQDEQLLSQAKLDIGLFHQLLNGICRLLLTDLFKADLKINCSVIDKNKGQQFVRFDFSVNTVKKIAQLPADIARLSQVESTDSGTLIWNDAVDYLSLLLNSLNVTDKNVQLQENGYLFSFTLPIAFSDDVQSAISQKVDLQRANILLISDDNNIEVSIQKAVSSANGIIKSVSKAELAIEQLSTKELSAKKVDMLILASDLYPKSLESLQRHIETLATNIQPKLFVMQPYFNAPLQRHGLFDQTANPLQIPALQQKIAALLATDKPNNIKLNASVFTKHQYLTTQVEVLFAVEDSVKHLTLLRILHWLGLQVKIVSQPEELLKFWSSGRYLLLLTEFEQSPFIELAAGKDVRRDIFTLKKSHFSLDNKPKFAEKWCISKVPDLDNLDSLVALLQPWLNEKHGNIVAIDKLPESCSELKKKNIITSETEEINESSDEAYSALNIAPSSDAMVAQQEPLNLEKYAENQGSAELAIVMLDDYVDDIDQAMQKLSIVLEEQNYRQGVSLIQSLIKTSTILAADDFVELSQQLLCEIKKDGNIAEQQVKILFDELINQQRLLSQFAEAI